MNIQLIIHSLLEALKSNIFIPHEYQEEAEEFITRKKRSALFLDPGLGKTAITLNTITKIKHKGVLIIAPLTVCHSVWPDEIEKWSNFNRLTYRILHGDLINPPKRKPKLVDIFDQLYVSRAFKPQNKYDIHLINPEGLPWLINELLLLAKAGQPMPFNTLWIDESTKFKSPKVRTKNGTRTRLGTLVDMLPLFKRRHIMTGTPAPKSLQDLWSQIYLLDNGASLGTSFYQFRNRYYTQNHFQKFKWDLNDGSKEKIEKAISHLVIDMSARDHLDLPAISFNTIKVLLSKKEMSLYSRMQNELFMILDDQEATASQAAIAVMKCNQISNGRVYEDTPDDQGNPPAKNRKVIKVHKKKVEALAELVDELHGKNLLVAYHYQHDLEALRAKFGAKTPYIGSGVSPTQVRAIVKKWNAGKIPILLGHPCSMSHGLNLQKGGNDICWFSMTWNLEHYLQFNARINRQGVKGAVRIHHLITKGTVDEAMIARLKQRESDQFNLRKALRKYRRSKG